MISTRAPVQTLEILTFEPRSTRGDAMFEALKRAARACGVAMSVGEVYAGTSDLLMLWGPGHPARFGPMRRQIARGGHVVALDLAYWQRETKIRVSIDAAHPQAWVMRKDWPASRFVADRQRVADLWNADGPVIIAGIGPKARVQYGAGVVDAWEAQMFDACRAQGRRVFYRRKYGQGSATQGASLASDGPIESVLNGASLLITWHSNVAVDAIRMGIPVVCRDGAASAVCPSVLSERHVPLADDVRARFLHNLAWFQWSPPEAASMMSWLQEALA